MARRAKKLTKRERKAVTGGSSVDARLSALVRERGLLRAADGSHARTMTDVIVEWAEPLLAPLFDGPLPRLEKGLTFAGLVWNAATDSDAPAEDTAEEILEDFAKGGLPVPETLGRLVVELIDSRRTNYAQERRVFLSAEVTEVGDDRRIRIAWGE